MAPMHYLRPDTLDDALAALDGGGRRIVAGCTDLFPATDAPALTGPVLDITAIAGLRGISRDGADWIIGATTTWSDVAGARLPPAFAALQRAARQVGAAQVQNRGTVAGNLCNASPAADGMPPLLTLDAEVELRSAASGRRRVPLAAFVTGPRRTVRRPDELVSAIVVPGAAVRGQSDFGKLGARDRLVISIAVCAARIELVAGSVAEAALAVGACGPVATRLPEVEAALTGHPPDPARITDAAVAAALSPIDDIRADAAYRTRAAAEMMRRIVAGLGRAAAA